MQHNAMARGLELWRKEVRCNALTLSHNKLALRVLLPSAQPSPKQLTLVQRVSVVRLLSVASASSAHLDTPTSPLSISTCRLVRWDSLFRPHAAVKHTEEPLLVEPVGSVSASGPSCTSNPWPGDAAQEMSSLCRDTQPDRCPAQPGLAARAAGMLSLRER